MKIAAFSVKGGAAIANNAIALQDAGTTYYFRGDPAAKAAAPNPVSLEYVLAVFNGALKTMPVVAAPPMTEAEKVAALPSAKQRLDQATKDAAAKEVDRAELAKQIAAAANGSEKKRQLAAARAKAIKQRDAATLASTRLTKFVALLSDVKSTVPSALKTLPGVSYQLAEVVLQPASTTGKLYQVVANKDGCAPNAAQQQAVIDSLLAVLDEKLQQFRYEVQSDAGVNYTCAVTAQPQTILNQLARMSLFTMEQIGFDSGNKNPAVFPKLGLRAENTDRTNYTLFNFFYRVPVKGGVRLWIPNEMPDLYVDASELDYCFTWKANAFAAVDVPAAASVPTYILEGNTVAMYVATADAGTSGAGGGAMRSDRVDEVSYVWRGPLPLGYALGLDSRLRTSMRSKPKDYARVPLPKNNLKAATVADGVMDSEIFYYKKFNDPPPKDKKNLPVLTIPATFDEFDKDVMTYALSGLVKKKKGTWEFSGGVLCKTGEYLAHKNTARASAGATMKAAFAEAGLDCKEASSGSATQFAEWLVGAKGDASARGYWGKVSANVCLSKSAGGDVKVDDQRNSIRTAQEWCHLFGHGDGGQEEFGNFIAGSKHCNTEQLAIETGQRQGKHEGLTARISAYLIPNDGLIKKVLTKADWAYLAYFKSSAFPVGNVAVCLAKLAEVILKVDDEKYPFDAILDKGGGSVPSAAFFAARSADDQRTLREDIVEQFQQILSLKYPVGAHVRYKVDADGVRVFSHTFNAQKEAFDYNEFKIVETTVRRAIAQKKGTTDDYVQSINMKVQARIRTEAKDAAEVEMLRKKYGDYSLPGAVPVEEEDDLDPYEHDFDEDDTNDDPNEDEDGDDEGDDPPAAKNLDSKDG